MAPEAAGAAGDPGAGAGPAAGAAPDPAAGDPEAGKGGKAAASADDQELRESGKRALDAEREARKAAERELQKLKDRDLSEVEKLRKDLAESETRGTTLEGEVRTLTIKNAFAEEARKAGALYPEDVWKLIDVADVKLDDKGRPENLERLIEKIRKERPSYFRPASPGSGDGGARPGGAGEGKGMTQLIREAAGR